MTEEEYTKQNQKATAEARKEGIIIDPIPYSDIKIFPIKANSAPSSQNQSGVRMNNMATQDNIAEIYEILAPMAGDYMNAQAEQIGQAQRSMGPMAAAVQGSTTSGLGNYTYNRLMRPQVDTMRDTIMAQGYANQLNRLLSDALTKARNNYNKVSSNSPNNKNTNAWQGDFENEKKDESAPEGSKYNPNDYVKNDYEFSNYGPLLGYSGQYPKLVESAIGSKGYEEYTAGISDPQAKAKKWYEYLKSIGYAG